MGCDDICTLLHFFLNAILWRIYILGVFSFLPLLFILSVEVLVVFFSGKAKVVLFSGGLDATFFREGLRRGGPPLEVLRGYIPVGKA